MSTTRTPDDIGPEAQIFVSDPITGMRGLLVIDSTALGPCGGGTRMLPDLTADEVADLARGMTYKFAILGFPRGGSKAGIWADPNLPAERRRGVLAAFGRALRGYLQSREAAVGPDMGVTVEDVRTIYAGAGAPDIRTGLFSQQHEGDAAAYHITGYGVVAAMKAAAPFADLDLAGARVAIEGFGQVGAGAARYAVRAGATVVAVSTMEGLLFNPGGLDVERLLELRRQGGDQRLMDYSDAERLMPTDIYLLPVDVLVPGARPYVINEANARQLQARLVVSGGNITTTAGAEQMLFSRGILSVPDFVSNSGAAIASWVDVLGGGVPQALQMVDALIGRVTADVLRQAANSKRPPVVVATALARERVLAAQGQPRKTFDAVRAEIQQLFARLV